jgi:PAS domain S-box-containing protein
MLPIRSAALALIVAAAAPGAARTADGASPAAGGPRPLVFVGDRDYRPLSYLDGDAPRGLDVEVGEAVAAALKRPARVELLAWDRAQEKVRAGDADVLLDMSVSEARKALYDFSTPVFEHEFVLFARAGDVQVSGLADLAGKRVGVTQGGFPRALLENSPGVQLVFVGGYRDALQRLAAGAIDAFAGDLWVGADALQASHLGGIAVVGPPFARQPYAMAVRKGDAAMLSEVNRALAQLERDGTLGRIRARWRPQEIVFASRQKVRETLLAGVAALLLLALGALALWVRSLKRHIAAQRRTEGALHESEERLRTALEMFPDAVVMSRPDRTVTLVNDGFTRLTGWSAAEAQGKTKLSLGLWQDPAQLDALYDTVLGGTSVRNAEARFRARDGTEVVGLVSSDAVTLNGERYVLCVTRDITDRKRAESEREGAMRELERLKARLEEENLYLKEEIDAQQSWAGIVGDSDALKYVFLRVRQVAASDTSVLIQGETGVGKELVARAIHEASSRSREAFIRVNCAALPANIVESELFGHEAGAFTGATRLRKGRFELAHRGTLFLDEVGELPLALQAKLLRVLQEGELERVGSSETLRVDVRVIAATNRNLKAEVAAARFREDLYYRLNVFPVTVPPLRERSEDIPLLVKHFVPQLAARAGREVREVPAAVLRALAEYAWPGNVRELRNVLERAVLQCTDGILRLPEALEVPSAPAVPREEAPRAATLKDFEKRHIEATLDRTQGRVSGPGGAAELLGINPNTLRSRMKKLGVQAGPRAGAAPHALANGRHDIS